MLVTYRLDSDSQICYDSEGDVSVGRSKGFRLVVLQGSKSDFPQLAVFEVSELEPLGRKPWLVFIPRTTDGLYHVSSRRRLPDYPIEWRELSDAEIIRLYDQAQAILAVAPGDVADLIHAKSAMLIERLRTVEALLADAITDRDEIARELEETIAELVSINAELQQNSKSK